MSLHVLSWTKHRNRRNLCNSVRLMHRNSTSWIDRYVPAKCQPYFHLVRADKQTGTLLLLWPCIWSTALAAPIGALPDALLIAKFTTGAVLMRGAGCIINDLWDRDFDRGVARTSSRPLAAGTLTPQQAMVCLGGHLAISFAVLTSFNTYSIVLGLCSMPLVVIYPLMKRYTNWPQLVLGLTFNWGALMGWAAVHGSCAWPQVLPLYGAGVCWTLVYDTLYGYQDRKDDLKLGLKSTAIHFGDKPQLILSTIASGMGAGLLATGVLNDLSLPYYVGASAVMTHMLWQIWTAKLDDTANLWSRFSSNGVFVGAALTASIIAGHF